MIEAPELITNVGLLGLGHQRRDRERGRRDADADDIDLIVDDHVLDDAARIVGNAAVVPHDQLDLAAGDRVTVLLHVKLDRGRELPADGVEAGAGHRHAHADFEDSCRRPRGVRIGPPAAVAATPLSTVLRNIVFPPRYLF